MVRQCLHGLSGQSQYLCHAKCTVWLSRAIGRNGCGKSACGIDPCPPPACCFARLVFDQGRHPTRQHPHRHFGERSGKDRRCALVLTTAGISLAQICPRNTLLAKKHPFNLTLAGGFPHLVENDFASVHLCGWCKFGSVIVYVVVLARCMYLFAPQGCAAWSLR